MARSSNVDELQEMINRGAGLMNRNQSTTAVKGAATGKRLTVWNEVGPERAVGSGKQSGARTKLAHPGKR
jgi:hypothetical protein